MKGLGVVASGLLQPLAISWPLLWHLWGSMLLHNEEYESHNCTFCCLALSPFVGDCLTGRPEGPGSAPSFAVLSFLFFSSFLCNRRISGCLRATIQSLTFSWSRAYLLFRFFSSVVSCAGYTAMAKPRRGLQSPFWVRFY